MKQHIFPAALLAAAAVLGFARCAGAVENIRAYYVQEGLDGTPDTILKQSDGSKVSPASTSLTSGRSQTFTANPPEGYEVGKWLWKASTASSTTSDMVDTGVSTTTYDCTYSGDGSRALCACFVRKTITVTFDANGGTGGTEVTQKYGTELAAPSVSRTGHKLDGWSPDVPSTMPPSNTTYTAKWTAVQADVTFDVQGGSGGSTSVTATYGEAMPAATMPVRTGYGFGGYFTAANGKGTQYYDADGTSARDCDLTAATKLYAKWTAQTYAVTFDRQSGNGGSSSVTVTYGEAMPAATMPTRTGYGFGGYFTEANGGGTQYYKADGTSARNWDIAAATVLYAKWTVKTSTVTLDMQEGSGGSSSVTAKYGAPMPSVTPPTRTGFTFGGYFTAANGGGTQYYNADGSSARNWDGTEEETVLYAQWTSGSYVITFDPQGGSGGSSSATTTYGAAMPSVTPPTRTGYDFGGYFTRKNGGGKQYYNADGTSARSCDLAAATTLYAKWTGRTYTVSFDAQGGSDGSSSATATYGAAMPSITLPTLTGHDFGGYFTEKNGGGTQYYDADGTSARNWDIAAATTLYAYWTAGGYDVILDKQGGRGGPSSFKAPYGVAMPSVTPPTRTGYDFGGYFTGTNGSGTQYYKEDGKSAQIWDKTEATVLYAEWTPKTYTFEFDANGGTGDGPASTNMTYEETLTMPTNTYAREHYAFLGWSIDKNAARADANCVTGAVVAASNLVKRAESLDVLANDTVTFYAVWQSDISVALDCSDLSFTAGSGWDDDKDNNHKGVSSMRQTGKGGGELFAVITNMSESVRTGTLSFWWAGNVKDEWGDTASAKLSLEYGAPQATNYEATAGMVTIDTVNKDGWSNVVQTITVPASGSVRVAFKNGSDSDTELTVWVDDVSWKWDGELGVVATGYNDKYDGADHGISVAETNGVDVVVRYATSAAGEFGEDVPMFKDVGEYTVWFEVSAPGYAAVTNSADVVISPRQVTLTSGSATKEYDGKALVNRVVTVGGDGFADGEGATYTVTGSQTDVGSSKNTFTYNLNPGTTAGNYDITTDFGTLEVTKGPEPVDPGVVVDGYNGKYDGAEHGISVEVTDAVDAVVRFATAVDGEFDEAEPVFKDVGTYKVWCEVSAPGYATVTNSADVVILRRQVTMTSGSAAKEYDGKALTDGNVVVGGDGFAGGEGATFDVTGSQTEAGSSENAFTYRLNAGTKAGNYDITTVFGTLTVTNGPEPEPVIPGVVVGGYTGKYDGAEHGISVEVTNDVGAVVRFATAVDGEFGKDSPMFKDVGTNTVWCEVSAQGYATVTNSKDVVILPREVTLTSGSATKEYDGNALTNGNVAVGGDGFADGEGATFNVTGSQTEVGSSENKFTCELNENTAAGNYSISRTFGTLEVTPASYDMGGVKWNYSAPFEYDGSMKTVALSGLPDGLSVSYSGNSARQPGRYSAVATFTSDRPNYKAPGAMRLEWEISQSGGIFFPGEGTVTVPKTWKAGKPATWKAKAAKGSVFAHWEGKLVDTLGLSRNELRNPSLKFTVPEDFDTNDVQAVFVSFDSDGLSSLSLSSDEALDFGAAVAGLEVLDDSESYVTASVSGLPSGLKFDKKTMAITGTPKKSGAFIVKITAKNASGYQWAENVALRVKDEGGNVPRKPDVPEPKRTAYHSLTVVSSDLAAGTVSGTGVYAEGKKASISAKAAKGKSFAGWYRDAALNEPMEFASGDFRKASQSVVVPEVRCLFAKFVAATAKDDPIKDLAAKGPGLFAEDSFAWRVGVAVPEGDGIEFGSESLPSASAAKLPAGVKFDAAKCRFTGVPTKAGTYEATVKVKNASKSAAELKLTIEVAALDTWAQGTFNGAAFDGDNNPTGQVSSLTVGANGKISGKLLKDGLTWTLSAASYASYDETGDEYVATVIGKSGKLAFTNEVTVKAGSVAAPGGGESVRGVADCGEWTAWQNLWKTDSWKAEAKPFAKAKALPVGDVTLKFASSGAVSAKLGSYSCSTVLIPLDENRYATYLYFPPKTGKFNGLAAEVLLDWDGASGAFSPAGED